MNKIYLLLTVILLCVLNASFAQPMDSLQKLKLYNEAFADIKNKETATGLQKLEDLAARLKFSDTTDLGILIDLAQVYSNLGNFEMAYKKYKQSMVVTKQLIGINDRKYAIAAFATANMGFQIALYEESELLLKEAIAYFEKNPKGNESEYADALNSLGGLYKHQRKLNLAEPLYLKALELNEKIYGLNSQKMAVSLNNMASLYRTTHKIKKAEEMYLQTKKVLENLKLTKHHFYVGVLTNLGGIYEDEVLNDPVKARYYHELAIKLGEKNLGDGHFFTLASINNFVRFLIEMEAFDEALQAAQKGLQYNAGKEIIINDDAVALIALTQNTDFIDSRQLLITLNRMIEIIRLKYQMTKDAKLLDIGRNLTKTIQSYQNRVIKGFSGESDKLEIYRQSNSGINHGLLLNYALYQINPSKEVLDEALQLFEHSKSALLAEALRSDEALHFGEVPDSLILKEGSLQKRSADLAKRQIEATQRKDSVALSNINKAKTALLEEQEAYKNSLKENYPKYHNLRYAADSISIESLQARLPNNESVLIEYSTVFNYVYVLYVSKTKADIVKLDISSNRLSNLCEGLYECLSDYGQLKDRPDESYTRYTKLAFAAYDSLLKPVLVELPEAKHLLIIPDADLLQIPFEAMLRSAAPDTKTNYNKLDYLCRHYAISYAYAAKLVEKRTSKTKENNRGILGVAAGYDGKAEAIRNERIRNLRRILTDLPSAREEVKSLEELFKGSFLMGEDATELSFKKAVGQYDIIHLALHGFADRRHPILSNLAFSEDKDTMEDNMLHAYEISQMDLNAELVVLSACETGYGQFKNGEGVLSLARSFMYAGVPSMVVSLWQVNDDATAQLMNWFYKNLSEGLSKDEALQQAKLLYLEACGESEVAHPAYWAAFIQLGDSQPIAVPKRGRSFKYLPWMIAGGGVILFGLFFLFRKRRQFA